MVQTCNEYVKKYTRQPSNNGCFHFPDGSLVICFSDLITKGSDNQCIHDQWTVHLGQESAAGAVDGNRESAELTA